MVRKLNKIQKKLTRLLPGCYINYGPCFENRGLVNFFIYFDNRRKYIKVSMLKDTLEKINIRRLAKEIKSMIDKQYYGIESRVVVFEECINEENHIPRID